MAVDAATSVNISAQQMKLAGITNKQRARFAEQEVHGADLKHGDSSEALLSCLPRSVVLTFCTSQCFALSYGRGGLGGPSAPAAQELSVVMERQWGVGVGAGCPCLWASPGLPRLLQGTELTEEGLLPAAHSAGVERAAPG